MIYSLDKLLFGNVHVPQLFQRQLHDIVYLDEGLIAFIVPFVNARRIVLLAILLIRRLIVAVILHHRVHRANGAHNQIHEHFHQIQMAIFFRYVGLLQNCIDYLTKSTGCVVQQIHGAHQHVQVQSTGTFDDRKECIEMIENVEGII